MIIPHGKNDHIKIVKAIAIGIHDAKVLDRYLELGIKKGTCFNIIAPLAKKSYAVDIDNCYKYIKDNKNFNWYHGASTDFLKSHNRGKKFDLVFIDADHKHESSLSDFELVFSLVNDNGIILLHDTYPTKEELINSKYCGDSYKTADYIRKNYSDVCEICTLPFYYGVSVVRKLDRQLMWKQK